MQARSLLVMFLPWAAGMQTLSWYAKNGWIQCMDELDSHCMHELHYSITLGIQASVHCQQLISNAFLTNRSPASGWKVRAASVLRSFSCHAGLCRNI